jgi:hypothetical protein
VVVTVVAETAQIRMTAAALLPIVVIGEARVSQTTPEKVLQLWALERRLELEVTVVAR